MIKPIRFITPVECAEGGSIGIYESEGGLPIVRTHDAIAGHVVNVEIRDTEELNILRDALNEFYGGHDMYTTPEQIRKRIGDPLTDADIEQRFSDNGTKKEKQA
jgi:hypothetical protein